MEGLGRALIIMGGLILITGVVVLLAGRLPFLGHLPGDIRIQRDNVSCSIPLATSLLLSILLTVVLNVVLRLLRK